MRKSIQEYQLQRDTQIRLEKLMSKSQLLKKRFRSASASSRKKPMSTSDKAESISPRQAEMSSQSPRQRSRASSPDKDMIRRDRRQDHGTHNDGTMLLSSQKFSLINSSMFR